MGGIDKFLDDLEKTFAYVREREGGDSVCGLCEYDGAYIGESGDWCNECPGFEKDDCFKLSDKIRKKWTEEIIKALPPAQPEERTKTHAETHACDLISRQAAVELAMEYCPDDDGTVQCDGDIRGLLDELENLPPAQPEEAIPVSWIEAKIARFMSMDNDFAGLTVNIIKTMLNEWRKEARSEREHNK